MVRRYGRYYKRYRSGKRRRVFTRYNTYKNRSAKAQAYQIYSLNKKLNKIERRTKPEFKTALFNDAMTMNTAADASFQSTVYRIMKHPVGSDTFNFANQIDGLSCRLINLKCWGYLQKNAAATSNQAYIRLVFAQVSKSRGANFLMNDCFENYTDNTATPSIIKAPLKDEITGTMRIIKNKIIRMPTDLTHIVNFRFNVKLPYNYMNSRSDEVNKGEIVVFAVWGQGFTTSSAGYTCKLSFKLCYTDA